MAWSTARTDLRSKINDGATDKLAANKKVLGRIDGINLTFKTFEFRRVTDFTTATGALGIYKNDVQLASSVVNTDDIATGYVSLKSGNAPIDGDEIRATYYFQWFTDAEMDEFNRLATNWLGQGDDPNVLDAGLRPACLSYAAALAFEKLSAKFTQHLSDVYRLEDMPDKDRAALIDAYNKLADGMKKSAVIERDDFYKRQGQALTPRFGISLGQYRAIPPRR